MKERDTMQEQGIALPNVSSMFGKVTRTRNTDRRNNARLANGLPFTECKTCGATFSSDDDCEWCE